MTRSRSRRRFHRRSSDPSRFVRSWCSISSESQDVMDGEAKDAREIVDEIYRSDSRRVLATLIRLLGDFDLAEEALHDAFAAALDRWPKDGVPENPRAWLVSTGRFKSIDRSEEH